jgi:multiple sugar transport system permease protein
MVSGTDNAETIPGAEIGPRPTTQREKDPGVAARLSAWLDASPKYAYLLPAIAIVLFLSVFPLIVSLYLSLSSVEFVRGGFEIRFVGLDNYQKLLLGSTQRQFLGRFGDYDLLTLTILTFVIGVLIYLLARHVANNGFKFVGTALRVLTALIAFGLIWLVVMTHVSGGLPGTLVVTMTFVFVGVIVQFLLGLGLALLVTQNLRGKRFFRVVFLLPMMITPVGIGFLFRMMTDTLQGPIAPLWVALGLEDFSWTQAPVGARAAVIIGDTWQWTPFIFVVLLAALEGVPREPIEAALVDGANRWQVFRYVIVPQLIPVSLTVIMIRIIEGFKIVDMPQVLTRGGPGTATESVTLQAFNSWRALDLGGSAAMAYLLLFVVTFSALVFVNFVRKRVLERL